MRCLTSFQRDSDTLQFVENFFDNVKTVIELVVNGGGVEVGHIVGWVFDGCSG